MVKRKRVPLQLKGTDEQYFRTKEIIGKPDPVEEGRAVESEQPVEKQTLVKAEPAKKPEPVKRAAPAKPARPKPREKTEQDEDPSKGEIVSRIIHLGVPLTKRLHDTAEKFGVPIDDLLYAARKKTIANFRRRIAVTKKPTVDEFEKGGETLRVAVSLSQDEMDRLRNWYDPLDIGLATKVVSPLMTASFRAEVKVICDGADAD
jgi:hypothetical protein